MLGCISFEFYVATAVLYSAIGRLRPGTQAVVMDVLSLTFSVLNIQRRAIETLIARSSGSQVAMKLFGVPFLPWHFMFLWGAFAQRVSVGLWRCASSRPGQYFCCTSCSHSLTLISGGLRSETTFGHTWFP